MALVGMRCPTLGDQRARDRGGAREVETRSPPSMGEAFRRWCPDILRLFA
ncbi:hypothetical protein B005_2754 [Nocardiopsis alba ATCC BAA-2165]|uniref:Uncharacterized protein n=1 Tax=Nocardiopsis alba (strain ATCC BAA-2165 / BE74) TaxID=1205910 RepID=J7L4C8_NOCAA|nr:hypothetical protein B005_2754 [Nocardiopsis alba ATCC BAA-2165]